MPPYCKKNKDMPLIVNQYHRFEKRLLDILKLFFVLYFFHVAISSIMSCSKVNFTAQGMMA